MIEGVTRVAAKHEKDKRDQASPVYGGSSHETDAVLPLRLPAISRAPLKRSVLVGRHQYRIANPIYF
ncbi:uncharacterized protein G2W53_037831 [Senna tora]|uniref:Uncharacterized protein n=1 Tax=Senna tora TaxID=362788 RepID=A0A834W1I9_9FABA|nr:uncharacterized protein G2W53_037831 [Senna tora]